MGDSGMKKAALRGVKQLSYKRKRRLDRWQRRLRLRSINAPPLESVTDEVRVDLLQIRLATTA
jgi:hypothetical protein